MKNLSLQIVILCGFLFLLGCNEYTTQLCTLDLRNNAPDLTGEYVSGTQTLTLKKVAPGEYVNQINQTNYICKIGNQLVMEWKMSNPDGWGLVFLTQKLDENTQTEKLVLTDATFDIEKLKSANIEFKSIESTPIPDLSPEYKTPLTFVDNVNINSVALIANMYPSLMRSIIYTKVTIP